MTVLTIAAVDKDMKSTITFCRQSNLSISVSKAKYLIFRLFSGRTTL